MNNVKRCYDRIDHIFAILVLIYVGVTCSVATMLFLVLQRTHCSIKTGYDVTELLCSNEEAVITRIGQRNELEPSLWCLISTILIKMCKMKGHAITIITATSKTVVYLIRFICIHGADLVTTDDNHHTSGTIMTKRMQVLVTYLCGGI